MDFHDLVNRIKDLTTDQRMFILSELLKDEKVSATELLVAKISQLEQFKYNAKNDILTVAHAGIELGEREMRRVLKAKGNTRKKDDSFYIAMVRCLMDAGAYRGTEFGKEIESSDFSSVDRDWYEQAWKPKTTNGRDNQ